MNASSQFMLHQIKESVMCIVSVALLAAGPGGDVLQVHQEEMQSGL